MMIKKVTITTALMAVGVITSLGYAAVAQTSRPESAPSQSTPLPNRPAPLPNQPLPNRPLPGSNSQLSALDNQFVMDAAHGGMAEVRLGQLALQRSTNPQVKQFAQRMIQEHTQANTELMRLTTQKGINAPTDVGPKYQAAMMRLMQLSGANFDQAYMNEAGVNAHLESTAVYQRQAALGQDPDLKAFASRTLPRVQGHLEMASKMTGYRFAQNGNSMPTSPVMNMPR
jgi:putative membrane protein